MAQRFERQTISFILRLWVESGEHQNQPQWRGQIEQVGSGEKVHFEDVTRLLETVAKLAPGFISPGTIEPQEKA